MKLKELLEGIEVLEFRGSLNPEEEIKKPEYDSRKIEEGDIFVAIKGHQADGHSYIPQAKERGAHACVVEDFVNEDILQIKVKDSRFALSRIAANFYRHPSKELNVVGVTATNGKTTTSFMLKEIYEEAGLKVGIIGTVFVKMDDYMIPSYLTTPESLDLQKHLAVFREKGADRVVMEVSSAAQELKRANDVDYNIVGFHNLSREHMEFHGTYEAYKKEKSKLITESKSHQKAVLNFDNEEIKKMARSAKATVFSTSMMGAETDFGIENLDLSTGRGHFDFVIKRGVPIAGKESLKKGSFPIDLNTAGYSSVMNSVQAISIALIDGIEISVIQRALKKFRGVERRFEMIFEKDYKIVDDHFANEVNIDVTLETLSKMDYKNLIMLYGIRGNRGVELNEENAKKIVEWKDKLKLNHIYASLSKDTVDWKDEVSDEERDAFLKVMKENRIEVSLFDTLEESVKKVIDLAKKDDVILFAGCQGVDKAARIGLNYILELHPDYEKDEILLPLKDRIV